MRVFVLNKNKEPLDPCQPARARLLLKQGKAKVYRRYPFTIILKEVIKNPVTHNHQLKIDPGAKTTGLAILTNNTVVWGAELTHRGFQIRDALTSRRQLRRSRRNRKTRYRKPRFLNRKRLEGWLAPSLMSRVHNVLTWVKKLIRFCPIGGIYQELVRFDTQKMENPRQKMFGVTGKTEKTENVWTQSNPSYVWTQSNPSYVWRDGKCLALANPSRQPTRQDSQPVDEISGTEYQQGTLYGYEVREYLLEKWNRKCAYCGATDTQLEIEHIKPKSKGGSDRVSNLAIACRDCNQSKGNQKIEQFLSGKPDVLKRVVSQAKRPLAHAAAVNATRWKLYNSLKSTGLRVETGSGGRTKYNRSRFNLPKTHWLDAACVGEIHSIYVENYQPLLIAAKGHGTRQICRTDKYGFPTRHCSRIKVHKGFQTGDIVKAIVTKGKKIGTYVGRVATRKTGSFNISTTNGLVQGISYKYCKSIHKKDGYSYGF